MYQPKINQFRNSQQILGEFSLSNFEMFFCPRVYFKIDFFSRIPHTNADCIREPQATTASLEAVNNKIKIIEYFLKIHAHDMLEMTSDPVPIFWWHFSYSRSTTKSDRTFW